MMPTVGWQRLIAAVLDCEKPVVAAVNGTAAGGGMHLALACDLVVASDSAKFIEVFVRRGIAPDAGGAWILPRLVGIQRAKECSSSGTTCRPRRPCASGWSTGSCRPTSSARPCRSSPAVSRAGRRRRSASPSG